MTKKINKLKRKQLIKKLKYPNIPRELLNYVIGEDYFDGEYTLKDELDKYGEDVIKYEYHIRENELIFFKAWTKTFVMVLLEGMFQERLLLGLEREIPERLSGK